MREYTRRISVLGNVPSHGPFIYFDDFEHLLKWTKFQGLGDAIFELDPTIAYSGNQSLYMKTRTTEAQANDYIGAERLLYMTPSLKLNQSIHFRCPDLTKVKNIEFYFSLDDGTIIYDPTIIFLPNTPKWQYRDSENQPQDIPGAIYPLLNDAWHRLQLLADNNTGKFIGMEIDSRHYDLSAIDSHQTPTGAYMHMKTYINIITIGNSPCELYIDDFLLHEL